MSDDDFSLSDSPRFARSGHSNDGGKLTRPAKALPILRKLHAQYGGSLLKQRDATDRWEAAWRWALTGTAVKRLCAELLPHLQLKAEQARLLMNLTPADGEVIRALVMELNRKGPTTTPMTGWFARHVGGRWLTPQQDLASSHGWEEFSETWPRSGMTRSGRAYRLPPLARLTGATESGSLLPTPTAGDSRASGSRNTTSSIAHPGVSLTDWARGDGGTGRLMLPTPTSDTAQRSKRYAQGGMPLSFSAAMLPTPSASDARSGADYSDRSRGHSPQLRHLGKGRLNPRFLEWMMGFPAGHTEFAASEMPSSRRSRKSSGES